LFLQIEFGNTVYMVEKHLEEWWSLAEYSCHGWVCVSEVCITGLIIQLAQLPR